jgi:hypothetical protein
MANMHTLFFCIEGIFSFMYVELHTSFSTPFQYQTVHIYAIQLDLFNHTFFKISCIW